MAETTYNWPSRDETSVLGKAHVRTDGIEKSTGAAKYTYDINLPNMLIARALGSPEAHARVKSINTKAAEKTPGVVHVHLFREPGYEIRWQGDLLAVVSAETEAAAAEGAAAIKVEYEKLDVFTNEEDLDAAKAAGRARKLAGKVYGDDLELTDDVDEDDEDAFIESQIKKLFDESEYVVEGYYGIDAITHCCLEPHGSTVFWEGDRLKAFLSTQNVSGTDDGFAGSLNLTADDVDVECQYIGGGFGSKFGVDYWGTAAAEISKATGRPVKFMLTRDQELKNAGNRPSGYIKVRLGADKKGVVKIWESEQWGSGGFKGGGVSPGTIPYVLTPANYRRAATSVATNKSQARAWRAPNHPQAAAMSQTAYDDLAAKMGADSLDVFLANIDSVSNDKGDVYTEELKIAAELIGWKANWHPHGKGRKKGSVADGLGIALHTWGGSANTSNAILKVHPDGGVSSYCGTQDLGTGTRTACAMVLAETFGLRVEDISVNIGKSSYPFSGASGGSTTIGAISESHRRAGQDALAVLLDKVATKLGVDADTLEAKAGRIQVRGGAGKSLSWKESCALLGIRPLEVTSSYSRGTDSPLSDSGVGGVQMAHVEVDIETGVIKMKKLVAVQDMGLVVNPLTAKSQITGALTMGIAYALYEQQITDPKGGAFVNAELSDYKLPRIGDMGELVAEIYEPESERQRGVIGLGEPPVISTGAAISNAVANALGVRVPVLPLTPKRVLDALNSAGRA